MEMLYSMILAGLQNLMSMFFDLSISESHCHSATRNHQLQPYYIQIHLASLNWETTVKLNWQQVTLYFMPTQDVSDLNHNDLRAVNTRAWDALRVLQV